MHPLSQIIHRSTEIFRDLGFTVVAGPEIETEFFNFDALNIPANHPARGMQDTFWLEPLADKKLLRTHTTAVSARCLKELELPFRVVSPGRVFRNEATDATHEAQFYQFDGLAVEKDANLGQLKWLLENYYRHLLGDSIQFRWRPSYFSFVEPGVELDIKWGDRWLEVVGAGMLHPNVFKAAGREKEYASGYRGLAFGSTVDRLAMIKYGIPDIRAFYGGDLRFLKQF
jgi:phenylalanyl-tRNA synthetase alpha chain